MVEKTLICPKCKHEIKIELDFTGLFIFNNSKTRDICPNCKKKVTFKRA